MVPWSRFALKIEIWDNKGELIRTLADIPASEDLPQGFGAVQTGPRSHTWQHDAAATLWWTAARDDGDPALETGVRDQFFKLLPPFSGAPVAGPELELRYSGITWGTGDLAVVYQSWRQNRRSVTMFFDPSKPGAEPRPVFDRSWEDRYNDPGSFYTTSDARGQSVLLMDRRKNIYT